MYILTEVAYVDETGLSNREPVSLDYQKDSSYRKDFGSQKATEGRSKKNVRKLLGIFYEIGEDLGSGEAPGKGLD